MSSKNIKNNKNKNISKAVKLHFTWQRILIFLIIVAITCGVGFGFKEPIERLINKSGNVETLDNISAIDDNGLSVHFIDVGQGDAIAIKFPDGKTMLVDAGTSQSSDSLIDYLNSKFFKNNSKIFDYLLLTHSDADHCGGMVDICKNFIINTIYRPYMYCKYIKNGVTLLDETNGESTSKNICNTATYYKTIKAFNGEINSDGESALIVWTDINTVNSTYKIQGENYYIDFYAPTEKYITESAGTVANDFSPIMVLNYNGKKIMLTGDASITSEQKAMNRAELPDVDLLKVGHHGSKTSSGKEFLEKVKPEISVISVGEGNSYKHPTTEALNRLLGVGSVIYRTDKNGTIIANVTSSSDVKLNIYALGRPTINYIRVEYLIAGVLVLAVTICFGIKFKV